MQDLLGKRVWLTAKGYTPDEGGMQTYARSTAEAFAALGAVVTVFTQTSIGPRDTAVGPVRLIDVGSLKSVKGPFLFLAAMRRELRHQGCPDLFHGTTWRTSILPMLLGIPYITTFHGREFMYGGWPVRALMSRVARKADRVIAVSRFTAAALCARVPDLPLPPVVAWNGVTAGLKAGGTKSADGDAPLVLSLCRLEPRKNVLASVHAAAACHREGLKFRFVLAGRGPDQKAIHTLVQRHGLQDFIELAGFVDQERATELYRDADIFMHPQITGDQGRDFEGFGIAIADAMYAGAAVVVGRDGGAQELVEDGTSGLVVDGRSAAAVTAALRELLQDRLRRQSLAAAATARAQREFRWDTHVRNILDSLASRS
jgi:phosphatidyl-myo-inositol dimannoside synthase